MAEQRKKTKGKSVKAKKAIPVATSDSKNILPFLLPVLAITFILFLPALKNGFTNWDDILYVTGNPLLKNLDGEGLKAIFTTNVVSNYHPITILSLALNYQFAELTPWSYHLTSIILHVINTGLVFWFIMLLSGKNKWVSAFSALLFGIHPMHVESVAWISERKDLLYTIFYLLALIVYIKYIQKKQIKDIIIVTMLGVLSLLCKPAAIVLPLSLLLLDYYYKRKWSWAWVIEKLPLFAFCAFTAYITVSIQSDRAIASVALHSFTERIGFAGFGAIWYLVKFIFPYPLSSLHPFPKELTPVYYLATVVAIVGVSWLLFKVKSRNYHFGFGFYLINLILVLQIVSIGNAVVAERYTYVPYISLFFLLCLEAYKAIQVKWPKYRNVILGISGAWLIALAVLTWIRIPVWKDSETLWLDVLKLYPESTRAWTNKGLIYYEGKEWDKVIADLSNALKFDPNYANALEWRARAYLEKNEGENALADALNFYKRYPSKTEAQFLVARSYATAGRHEEAVTTYNELISKVQNVPDYYNNRGAILFNKLNRYEEARKDFEHAVQLNPKNGLYFLNLSRSNYMLKDIPKALEFAKRARELGEKIDPSYAAMIGLQ